MFRYIYPLIFTILSCVLLSSCIDPVQPSDTEAPVVTVKSPIKNQKLAGTITIEATAIDRGNGAGLSMQVFLDGKLSGKGSDGLIRVQVDTKTLTEGSHTIQVTATDKAGNVGDKTVNVEVRNTLFKVYIYPDYVLDNTQVYYVLSQNDGSLISVNQLKSGSTITVPTPAGFNLDSSFVFTEYNYLHGDESDISINYTLRTMTVYAGLHAGEFNIPKYPSVGSVTVTGTHHMEITDVPTGPYIASGMGNSIGSLYDNSGDSGTITADLTMVDDTSDFYFYLDVDTKAPVYNYISSVRPGESTQFSIAGLPQMPKAEIRTNDIAGNYFYIIYNDVLDFPKTIFYDGGNFDDGKLPMYYPGSSYPKYVFQLSHWSGSHSYANRITSASPPTSFQYLNAAVTDMNYANRKLKIMSSGSFDMVMTSGGSNEFTGTSFTGDGYSVYFPQGTKNQITIPNIPVELSALGFTPPAGLVFESTIIFDYLKLSGANDYQNKIAFSADNVLRQNRDFISSQSLLAATSSGGRLSTQKKITLPKSLEVIFLRNHFRPEDFGVSF